MLVMRKSKIVSLLCCASLLLGITGCSNSTESSDVSEVESSAPVGDFNFQAQQPVSTTSADTSAAVVERNDGELDISTPDLGTWEAPVSSDASSDASATGTTEVSLPEESVYIPYESSYTDLATNISLRIGANGYISVPQSLVSRAVDLDSWLESTRLAYNLISEEDRNTSAVQDKIYANGNLVYVADNVMSIIGKGIAIDVKNTHGTLSMAQSVSAKTFALGRLKSDTGSSYESAYTTLGAKIDEQDEELFYRAVYEIADVADLENIDAQAVVLLDKQTDTMMLVTIGIDKTLCSADWNSVDLLIGSVRYSTVAPDNLATIR